MPTRRGEARPHRTGGAADVPLPSSYSRPTPRPARASELAAWLTSPDNPYFARSYVNRLWGYLFGVGIIEPIDDMRAGNPASNPELLDYLTQEFVAAASTCGTSCELIASRGRISFRSSTNSGTQDDKINYSHATARRLPAEVLYDAVYSGHGLAVEVPGRASRAPGRPSCPTRASSCPAAS